MMWKALGKVLLAAVLFLVLNLVVSIPIGVVGGMIEAVRSGGEVTPEGITEVLQDDPWLRTASYVLSALAGAATAAILYFALERGERSWTLGWRQSRRMSKGLFGLAAGAALILLSFFIVQLLGGIRILDAAWGSDIAAALAFDVVLFTAVGIGEEVFSRGYVYGVVKQAGGIGAAVLVSSLLFALLHLGNPAILSSVFPLLNLLLAGVMLALFREWSGGLWVPIGVHMTWNYFQGNVLGMAVSGVETKSILKVESLNDAISGGAFGLEGSFAVTLVTGAVSLWLALAIRRRGQHGGGAAV